MAKGKHSVALFEVIQSGKTSSRGNSLRTPKWWFKSPKAEAPAAPPTAVVDPVLESNAPAPRMQGVDLKLDPDGQRIKFDLSYSSAIVAAFSVIVIISMAYIIGTHLSRGPSPAAAGQTTAELRQGPAQPSVMNIQRNQSPSTPIFASAGETPRTAPAAAPPAPMPAQQPAAEQAAAQQRVVGRNYLVVQSYTDEKVATTLRDTLIQNGVACTIERGLNGYGTRFCILTTTGFDRIRDNPDYDRFKASLIELGTKLSATSKTNKLDPHAYRWNGQAN
jgi:hypothetical protein